MEILIFLIETRNAFQSLNLSPTKNAEGRGFFVSPSNKEEISILLDEAKFWWLFPVKGFPPMKDKC